MTDRYALRTNTIFILLAAGAILFAQLGRTVLNEHEVFAAQPGREILQGGSIVLQQFAGEYRTKKPPGQSWLIAASLYVTQSESEWAARLPSALSGTGLALVLMVIGSRLVSPRVGLLAGLMTLTCYVVQQRARLAEADTGLSLAVACAFACIVLPMVRPIRKRWAWSIAFWFSIVAGFLLKGPLALGFALPPVIVFYFLARFWLKNHAAARSVARVAFWPPGVVLGVLGILAWPACAIYTHPAVVEQWQHETINRVAGAMRVDPFYSYLYTIPTAVLPWVFAAPWGVRRLWELRLFRDAPTLLLVCWGVGGFLLVSAIPFKTMYYAMPMVAPVILLSAYGFDWLFFQRFRRSPDMLRRARAICVALFAGTFVAFLIMQGWFEPRRDRGGAVVKFAESVNGIVPATEMLYLYKTGEDRTAWYLHSRLQQVDEIPTTRPIHVVTEADELPKLPGAQELHRADPYGRRDNPRERRVLVRLD